jgi:hypothetical protein
MLPGGATELALRGKERSDEGDEGIRTSLLPRRVMIHQ